MYCLLGVKRRLYLHDYYNFHNSFCFYSWLTSIYLLHIIIGSKHSISALKDEKITILDLTYDFTADTLVWPKGRRFEITKTNEGQSDRGYW